MDKYGELRIWDTETTSPIKTMKVESIPTGKLKCLAWSSDGKYIASGSGQRELFVWSVEDRTVEGEGRTLSEIDGIGWYPNDHAFITPDGSGAIVRWDVLKLATVLTPFKDLLEEIHGGPLRNSHEPDGAGHDRGRHGQRVSHRFTRVRGVLLGVLRSHFAWTCHDVVPAFRQYGGGP